VYVCGCGAQIESLPESYEHKSVILLLTEGFQHHCVIYVWNLLVTLGYNRLLAWYAVCCVACLCMDLSNYNRLQWVTDDMSLSMFKRASNPL